MIAIEFNKNEKYSFADAINEELLQRNIIIGKRPGHEVFRIDPVFTIENEQVDFFLNSIEDIISKLKI